MKIIKKTAIYLSFIACTHCTSEKFTSVHRTVLISEVLFNPKKDGVDFVELYNYSDDVIDLRELALATLDKNKQISQIQVLTSGRTLFYPGEYLTLTTNPMTVQSHYPGSVSKNFIKMVRLPSFNNESGTVILLQRKTSTAVGSGWTTLDSLAYQASMHSRFLKDVKGISLERRSLAMGTNIPGNFTSSAMDNGGATPGYRNSGMSEGNTHFQLSSNILYHDKEGYADELRIHYNIAAAGLVANILIYDPQNRVTKHLVQHSSISSMGTWKWNGYTDQQKRAQAGIYTLVAELYNDLGFHLFYRKSFVIRLRN